MNSTKVLTALSALAQETRLAIFRLLVSTGEAGLAAGEIAHRLGVAAPTLSFHLKELQHAGLLVSARHSRQIVYSANFTEMQGLLQFLYEDCCGGRPDLCVPVGQSLSDAS